MQYILWHMHRLSSSSASSSSLFLVKIGHNLNLDHASEGGEEYGDETGMMGYSYADQDSPKKCFNGAKSCECNN